MFKYALLAASLTAATLVSVAPASAQLPAPTGIADLYVPRISISAIQSDLITDEQTERKHDLYTAVSYGAVIPVVRFPVEGYVLSSKVEGSFLGRFRTRAREDGGTDFDLTGTDWLVGLHTQLQGNPWTLSVRPYHRSSHLGDDMVLYDSIAPHEAREERVEFLVRHQTTGALSTYGGYDQLFIGNPTPLAKPKRQYRTGFDYTLPLGSTSSVVAGADFLGLKKERRESYAAGVRFVWQGRDCFLLLRHVRGPSPMGQFQPQKERLWAIELSTR